MSVENWRFPDQSRTGPAARPGSGCPAARHRRHRWVSPSAARTASSRTWPRPGTSSSTRWQGQPLPDLGAPPAAGAR